MENNYSNYDMFDKFIANNKKAKSWTAAWILALLLFAAAVLWMAIMISQKNKTISEQQQSLQTQEEFLEAKNLLIDSLVANCNSAKKEIVNKYDSVITETDKALNAVVMSNPDEPIRINEVQQENLKNASKNLKLIKSKMDNVKANIYKPVTRLFIQYNQKEKEKLVEQLSARLKSGMNYYIAPPEYIDNNFPTVIKFYNYEDAAEAALIKKNIATLFAIDPGAIEVKAEKNDKIKQAVEVWIGTRPASKSLLIRKIKS